MDRGTVRDWIARPGSADSMERSGSLSGRTPARPMLVAAQPPIPAPSFGALGRADIAEQPPRYAVQWFSFAARSR
ncbi:MAG: hypothetical protein LKM31_15380 [Sphingobium sp.]|nr:hypothetical protein [Sphingobium sp.]